MGTKSIPLRRRDATKQSPPRSLPAATQLALELGDETPDRNRRPAKPQKPSHHVVQYLDPEVLHSIAMLTEQVTEAANGIWALKDTIAKLGGSRSDYALPTIVPAVAGWQVCALIVGDPPDRWQTSSLSFDEIIAWHIEWPDVLPITATGKFFESVPWD